MMRENDHIETVRSAAPPRRRGSTLTAVLTAIGIVGTFAAVVYVVVPTDLYGDGTLANQPVAATHESNQELIDSLAALIGRSAEVIAIHPRTGSPYMEIVLRLDRTGDADAIPANQIAVLSHSSVLHTVMFFSLEDHRQGDRMSGSGSAGDAHSGNAPARSGSIGQRPGTADREGTTQLFSRSELAHPGFGDRWRSNPNIRPRLLARGISDMQVQVLNRFDERSTTLQLSLTWSPDSADGRDTAAVLVNAAMNRRDE